ASGGPLLGRTFDGVPQKGRDRVAETLWSEERLRSSSALLLGVRLEDTQEYGPLVAKDGIQTRPSDTHPGDQIVNRHAVVAFRPEHLRRLFQRPSLVEAARPSTRLWGILNHSVHNSLTTSIVPV